MRFWLSSLAFVGVLGLGADPSTSLAQTASAAKPVCFAKTATAEPNLTIAALPGTTDFRDEFANAGFGAQACSPNRREIELFRDQICEVARLGNPTVVKEITKRTSLQPGRICAAAQAFLEVSK